jgi:hypothetical protein
LVSTLPLVDAGAQAGIALGSRPTTERVAATWRATIDPDNYTGFGTWSGTSFAAPVTAAVLSAAFVTADDLADLSPRAAANRSLVALQTLDFPGLVVTEEGVRVGAP